MRRLGPGKVHGKGMGVGGGTTMGNVGPYVPPVYEEFRTQDGEAFRTQDGEIFQVKE
jgi:hypothetical protein